VRLIYFLVGLFLIFSFSGCAIQMKGSINSMADPTYVFDKNSPIFVTVLPQSENSLQSKYYISRAVSLFERNGFRKIFVGSGQAEIKESAKIIVFVDVSKKTSSFSYRGADYGMVQSGSVKNCNAYEYGNSAAVNCTTTPVSSFGVTGYSDKIGYTTDYVFLLEAFDVGTKQKVLSVQTTARDVNCADDKVYDFLAEQAMARMSFNGQVRQDFSVKMPNGYRCK
jgi:hypothetical protein